MTAAPLGDATVCVPATADPVVTVQDRATITANSLLCIFME